MTPSQLIRPTRAPENPPCSPVPESEQAAIELPMFTSAVPEEDLDTAVTLLLGSLKFLLFLQDANEHYDILGGKTADDLNRHIELLEDFTGQWNEEQVY